MSSRILSKYFVTVKDCHGPGETVPPTYTGCTVTPLLDGAEYASALQAALDRVGRGESARHNAGQCIMISGWWLGLARGGVKVISSPGCPPKATLMINRPPPPAAPKSDQRVTGRATQSGWSGPCLRCGAGTTTVPDRPENSAQMSSSSEQRTLGPPARAMPGSRHPPARHHGRADLHLVGGLTPRGRADAAWERSTVVGYANHFGVG
jgi:hypothetical protein